jgi:hypothetical protein
VRFAAIKSPRWSGRIVEVTQADRVFLEDRVFLVKIDGITPAGDQLTGREVLRRRVRWFFYSERGLGLPPWCRFVA